MNREYSFAPLPAHCITIVGVLMIGIQLLAHADVLVKQRRINAPMYGVKSGVINYDRVETANGATTHTHEIVYFDDFGATERQEIYDAAMFSASAEPTEIHLGKGEMRYTYYPARHKGGWSQYDGAGIMPRFDLNEGSDALKKDEGYKEIPGDTICGKPCIGASASPAGAGTITAYGWQHVMLKYTYDFPASKNTMNLVATSFEEAVAIPADKWLPPAGFKMEGK